MKMLWTLLVDHVNEIWAGISLLFIAGSALVSLMDTSTMAGYARIAGRLSGTMWAPDLFDARLVEALSRLPAVLMKLGLAAGFIALAGRLASRREGGVR